MLLIKRKERGKEKMYKHFERKGECKQCGICCIPENCSHFIKIKSGGICAIHESKPKECHIFPIHPNLLYEGCGFYFIDKRTGNISENEKGRRKINNERTRHF